MDQPLPLLIITATLGNSPFLSEVLRDIDELEAHFSVVHVMVGPESALSALKGRRSKSIVVAEPTGGKGLYEALNAGASVCPWRWMTYINDDDRLYAGLSHLCLIANSTCSVDVIYGDVDYLARDGSKLATFPICRHPADVSRLLGQGVAPFTQQGTLVSSQLWHRLGGFDPTLKLAADFDFWVRAAACKARFHYVPGTVAGFRIQPGQLSGDIAQVQIEIADAVARANLQSTWFARALALSRFRLANAPRILARIFRTRRGRTRSVLGRPA